MIKNINKKLNSVFSNIKQNNPFFYKYSLWGWKFIKDNKDLLSIYLIIKYSAAIGGLLATLVGLIVTIGFYGVDLFFPSAPYEAVVDFRLMSLSHFKSEPFFFVHWGLIGDVGLEKTNLPTHWSLLTEVTPEELAMRRIMEAEVRNALKNRN